MLRKDDDMKTFGAHLVEAREKLSITQKQLAELLEITATRLNYWEKDKRQPDIEMIRKIAKILKTDRKSTRLNSSH